jgi:biofilm PGA synthesis protein PgaA
MLRLFRRAYPWLSILIVGVLGVTAVAQTASQQREAAVLKARAGQMADAQAALRALLAAGIDDGLVAMDLATLLQQDGKPAEAVAVFEKAAIANPPEYALLAATRAHRDVDRFDDAVRLGRQGMARFPGSKVWPLLVSLALSDSGRSAEALELLRGPAAGGSDPVERLMAEAYAWRRAGDPSRALQVYAAAMRLEPANQSIRTEAAGVLQGLGAPFGAEAVAGRLTPSIAADQAAVLVRWSQQIPPRDPARRFDATDVALARLEALLASLPAEEKELRRRIRLDRLVALLDRGRASEVVGEGRALSAEGPLPPYAEQTYADALLYMRQPEAAREGYRRVLAQSPKDVGARYGLFYASVDLEDWTTAYATIDGLVADQPAWRYYRGDPTPRANPERTTTEVTAAQARFYGNQISDAWERIVRISEAAPAESNARIALYQIASARGWQKRATEEAEIAASLAPLELGAKIGLIETAMANCRFAEAQRLLDALRALYPENRAVQRLARDLDAKKRWVLELDVKPGNSDGGGPNASGKTVETEGHLYSPPIADNFRLFGLGTYSSATPPEGFVDRGRLGGGLEWRTPDLTARAYPTYSWGTLPKAGGGATLDWAVTDEIKLGLGAELYSTETPLRAQYYNILSNSYSVSAAYRWHEARSLRATFGYSPFSDGNQRLNGGVTFKELLVNLPGFDLTGRAEAYASSNSLVGAPYYNPARDLSVTGGLLAEHALWRRYDTSLVHALAIDAGLYAEQGYANNWIGTVNYEHRWRFDPLTELRYGVALSRRVYDGVPENAVILLVGIRQRI